MKNYIRFCIGFIAVFILFSCLSCAELKEMKKFARTVSIVTPDLNSIHDGDYTGEFQSGVVRARVMVTVNNNRMDNITILEHQTGMGKKAELIIDDVLNAQSLDVDSISGATISSKVILKAIEEALNP
jgi:uncharacterized protein with FMN-binding domain